MSFASSEARGTVSEAGAAEIAEDAGEALIAAGALRVALDRSSKVKKGRMVCALSSASKS